MKAVLTRVKSASVTVDGEVVGAIDCPETGGILALVGVGRDDAEDAWEKMARKIAELRILDGERSAQDAGAPVLLVSQFTLMGRTAKGRRPSWADAAPGEAAAPVIAKIAAELRGRGITVEEGRFGAMMDVASVNSGPFTVLVDA
ncbi:D-tyrosyl-tRNA(Tyr) deacylase [Corynebacterium godavarianum]|uniref:D-aminoacyl-tRNA deacylase n=1 Tax=Corynebacterium godavarianum TaxID=2054421 RepID=A0ABY3E8H6_9CORY|nr:D-aminoacyl-tRNA deacylase [Corynebacterium godavarianum]MBL7286075.1 D-tyrosyl-tRNA(Tyr) deacylase [Corynebacterium godavarianum]TSJ76220.1 D-tyrosyl-tRNA(Tyr) deacylase [Corynebacterium godavarianum]